MKKERHHRSLTIILFITILLASTFYLGPALTGFVVWGNASIIWDFEDKNDYTFDENLINFTENGVELIPTIIINKWNETIEITVNLLSAKRGVIDVTDNLLTIDNKKVNINQQQSIDIILNKELNTEDILRLYLQKIKSKEDISNLSIVDEEFLQKEGKKANLYLCDYEVDCTFPGYGSVHYDNTQYWNNITLEDLTTSKDRFRIRSTHPVLINYLEAIRYQTVEMSSELIQYPSSADIETKDLILENISKLGVFNTNYKLNGQSISYQYSTGSGLIWISLDDNSNLESVPVDKIRFKATLSSDQSSTPILKEIWLGFTPEEILCDSNWNCTAWTDCSAGSQSRLCSDLNLCELDKTELQNCTVQETSPPSSGGGGGGHSPRIETEAPESISVPPVVLGENNEETINEKNTIRESCEDGIKNQNEEGIDCGGVCEKCELDQITGRATLSNLYGYKDTAIYLLVLILTAITLYIFVHNSKKIRRI